VLNKEEINRYSRHLLLSEIGTEGQGKLKRAKVLVIGAGGLGCPVLLYLAAAGVGFTGIVDDDLVDESNLQRQILFTMEDVRRQKADVAAKKLKQQNPHINIKSHITRLSSANALEIISNYDLVIDGSDNFPTRYLVNDACVMLNKPLVFGSIFRFEGQVSVFNYRNGPTYRCLFPDPPGPGEVPNCSEVGVLGVLPGMIGTFMANEALKIILGIGNVLSGKLFVLDALSMNTQVVSFEKNPANAAITALIDYEAFCNSSLSHGKAGGAKEISVSELRKLIESKADIQLIDVRERSEYLNSNIQGENIPLGTIEDHISRIARDKKVVIHCKMGGRSRKAIEVLEKKYGFTNLYNLTGGIDAWK
jgi:adenylyltransferase/sulfurtransferase